MTINPPTDAQHNGAATNAVQKPSKAQERQERLAKQLRANLMRRKSQARERQKPK